jgi:SNF2 family DNA or RNA helicase
MKKLQLYEYQKEAVEYVLKKKKCGLFLGMGLGKTIISLVATKKLLESKFVKKVLLIAPLRVCNTVWKQEAENWEELKSLKIRVCTGLSSQKRLQALNENVDICILNKELVSWFVENKKGNNDFDMLIIDESSAFKSYSSQRFKSLKQILPDFKARIILTGTPSPNSAMDLWSQIYCLDEGAALGKNITTYRYKYFNEQVFSNFRQYSLKEEKEEILYSSISHLILRMSDKIKLPEKIDITQYVNLPESVMHQYKTLLKKYILEIENSTITAANAAVVVGKLTQIANGAIYDEDKTYKEIHSAKIDALQEILEDNPSENILLAYQFKSDIERIINRFPKAVLLSASGKELTEWNNGKIRLLLAHPQSAGHGLNAQFGGSIILWFGLPWSLENYQQFNARLHRQGQKNCVRIVHLIAQNTVEERILEALRNKEFNQEKLLRSLSNEFN